MSLNNPQISDYYQQYSIAATNLKNRYYAQVSELNKQLSSPNKMRNQN